MRAILRLKIFLATPYRLTATFPFLETRAGIPLATATNTISNSLAQAHLLNYLSVFQPQTSWSSPGSHLITWTMRAQARFLTIMILPSQFIPWTTQSWRTLNFVPCLLLVYQSHGVHGMPEPYQMRHNFAS